MIATNAGQDAVAAGLLAWRARNGGRSSRVVLSPRRWGQACQSNLQATGANKPGTPRRARSSRKTIAQGMPDVRLYLTILCALPFFSTQGLRVRPAPGIPCALRLIRGTRCFAKLGRICVARMRGHALRCRGPPCAQLRTGAGHPVFQTRLDSSTAVSGILGRPVKPDDDIEYAVWESNLDVVPASKALARIKTGSTARPAISAASA
jgi:hypothetical protein